MDTSAVDFPALVLAAAVALAVTVVLILVDAGADANRRGWLAAAGLAVVLLAVGLADLLREDPRETHVATVLLGATLPVLGAAGMVRGTRRMRHAWLRGLVVFLTAFVLLFVGLLVGAALVPRLLGS